MTWRLEGRSLRRVLVTRLRYLGDVVLSTVVADVLKRGDPGLEIGFLCEADHAPVLTDHPSIDRVHVLGTIRSGADAAARPGSVAATGRGTFGMVGELRRARYDLAVDLFFNPRSAWLLRLAGIPLRIGGTAGGRRRLYTHAVPRAAVPDPDRLLPRLAPGTLGDHVCRLAPLTHGEDGRSFLDWLARSAADDPLQPRLAVPALGPAGREALRAVRLDPDGAWLLAAPGATWQAKEWPLHHWQTLLRRVRERTRLGVAVLLPPGREQGWTDLSGALPTLTLPEALGVVGRARALVTVDGGIMHAAVAMGTPTVALFGPTDTDIWFPYGDRGAFRVLARRPACYPCDRHTCPPDEFVCLPSLDPEAVAGALDGVLGATGGAA